MYAKPVVEVVNFEASEIVVNLGGSGVGYIDDPDQASAEAED